MTEKAAILRGVGSVGNNDACFCFDSCLCIEIGITFSFDQLKKLLDRVDNWR